MATLAFRLDTNSGASPAHRWILGESPVESFNGIRQSFTFGTQAGAALAAIPGSVRVLRNGVLQDMGSDFSVDGWSLNLAIPPESGEIITLDYAATYPVPYMPPLPTGLR